MDQALDLLNRPVIRLAILVVILMFILRAISRAVGGGQGKGDYRKKIRSEIKLAKKIGNFQQAGMLHEQVEQWDDAVKVYKDNGLLGDAARVLAKTERLDEAKMLLSKAGLWKELGEILKNTDPRGAAEAFRKGGDFLRAAETLDKADLTHEAADDYRKAGLGAMASQALKTAKTLTLSQAKELEADVRQHTAGHVEGTPFNAESLNTVKRICKVYVQHNLHQQAVDLAIRFELYRLAAQMGADGKAKPTAVFAEACARGGEHETAAAIYEQIGEKQAAALQRATGADKRGELVEAARWYAAAGEEVQAAELHLKLQQPEKAAELFDKGGDLHRAADIFAQLGNWKKAAAIYERLNLFDEAAHAHEKAGDQARRAQALEKSGRLLEAAKLHSEQGRVDKAISVAQQVTEDSADFRASRTLLAQLFVSKGDTAMGIRSLERALQGMHVTRDNVESYYTLGTLYEKNGEFSKAVEILEQVVAEAYNYKDVKDRLGRLKKKAAEQASMAAEAAAQASLQASARAGAAPSSQGVSVRLSDVAPSGAGTAAGNVAPDGRTQLDIQTANKATGRYRLDKEVGAGGMGVVYRAFDTVLNRPVAYKMMPTDLKSHPEAAKFFIDEARATAQLSHPNIVHVYDCGEDERGYFIVMEFIEGESFDKVLRKKKISIPGVVNIAQQVAAALSHAHSRKLIHRDLKPSNLLWTSDKKVMLLDFGLARALNELGKVRTRVSGTPYYMAPEQVRGGELDARCDLYSLGAVLYELCCNRPPFTDGDVGYHHNHTPPPNPQGLRPDTSPELAWLILKLMEKKPENRFQSADELQHALKQIREGTAPAGYKAPA